MSLSAEKKIVSQAIVRLYSLYWSFTFLEYFPLINRFRYSKDETFILPPIIMFLLVYRTFPKKSTAWVKDETIYFEGFAIPADLRWSNLTVPEDETLRY